MIKESQKAKDKNQKTKVKTGNGRQEREDGKDRQGLETETGEAEKQALGHRLQRRRESKSDSPRADSREDRKLRKE